MLKRRWFFLVLVCVIALAGIHIKVSSGEIISQDRRTTWDPGIPGGIPYRSTVCANVKNSPYNAYGDGVHDDTTAIQNAINNCPVNQVVYLPEGIYRITGTLSIQKGIVLRGDGPGRTKINLDSSTAQRVIVVGSWYEANSPAVSVTGGMSKDSKSITVSDASTFSVGDFITLDQRDGSNPDVSRGNCTWFKWNDGTDYRSVGQMNKIVSKNGNILGLETGLHYGGYSATYDPRIYRTNPNRVVQYAGIEDLYMTRLAQGGQQMILFQIASYSWIKNVEVYKGHGRMIAFWKCYRCVLRDSYIHESWTYATGAQSYGVTLIEHTSDSLVENNIVYYFNAPIFFENSGGGNVVAYNYADDALLLGSEQWQMADIGTHCSWPHMELIEGNYIGHYYPDDIHGGSGYLTFFRNYSSSHHRTRDAYESQNREAMELGAYNWYGNVVGNILNQAGDTGQYEGRDGVNWYSTTRYAFRFRETEGYNNTYRHGNYSYITDNVQWDAANPDHNLPASLYLSSKPTFFGNLPWPATGPDLSPMVGDLPAKIRFENIQNADNKQPSPPVITSVLTNVQ